MIGIITSRVELNPKKLEEFIKALESVNDDDTYEEVIRKLKGKYLANFTVMKLSVQVLYGGLSVYNRLVCMPYCSSHGHLSLTFEGILLL